MTLLLARRRTPRILIFVPDNEKRSRNKTATEPEGWGG
jgi:hypothetical protein